MRTAASLAIAALLLLSGPVSARAQFFDPEPTVVQTGLGALPGAGLQVSYVQPRTIYTIEASLYADVQSLFRGDARRFQAAGAIGAALRTLTAVRVVAGLDGTSELDLGLRVGPGLSFKANETRADKNRRFRLLLDPFVRYLHPVGGLTLFGEVGLARPRLRFGLWFQL